MTRAFPAGEGPCGAVRSREGGRSMDRAAPGVCLAFVEGASWASESHEGEGARSRINLLVGESQGEDLMSSALREDVGGWVSYLRRRRWPPEVTIPPSTSSLQPPETESGRDGSARERFGEEARMHGVAHTPSVCLERGTFAPEELRASWGGARSGVASPSGGLGLARRVRRWSPCRGIIRCRPAGTSWRQTTPLMNQTSCFRSCMGSRRGRAVVGLLPEPTSSEPG